MNIPDAVADELAQIEARRRPFGRPCSVASFLAVATETHALAFHAATARGLYVETANHFRAKYPQTLLCDKGVRRHASRVCRCFHE